GQSAVRGQRGGPVTGAEVDCARIATDRVVEGVLGGDGEAEGAARSGAGRGVDPEVGEGGGADGDGVTGAGDGAVGGVGGAERPAAGRLPLRARASSDVGQSAVRGQRGGPITGAEVDGAGVAGGGVVEGVLGGDSEAEGAAGAGTGRHADG